MSVLLFLSVLVAPGPSDIPVANTSAPAIVSPFVGTVIQRFVAPACDRCAGHRGVTVSTTAGDHVLAVAHGEITFAGSVGGKVFVVEQIRPGIRVTYGWLTLVKPGLAAGTRVSPGQAIGSVGERSYLGVRVGNRYVEPLSFLGLWRARLVGPGGVSVGRAAPPR